eukprot:TRINITY_DN9339_c0_g2_i1.p1 TRINITY_DN9339_c0_g2~~TRINITY_DN9339_c0_g2_i1.p1  ORF type:complete len:358 (-),score=114.29 TRINITY_DN9339_c0_g2_i1:115-1188(-)
MSTLYNFTLNLLISLYNFSFGIFLGRLDYVNHNHLIQPKNILLDLEKTYGEIHPTFFEGKFEEAINYSKEFGRFLIVYVHSGDHENTPNFCEGILFTEIIQNYVDENYVLWIADITTKEGAVINKRLKVSTYPYIGIIHVNDNGQVMLRTHRAGDDIMSMTVDDFMTWLLNFHENNQHLIDLQRSEREQREQDRLIMEEQDLAFQQALEADKEKERLRNLEKEEEEKKRIEAEELEKQLREKELLEQQKLIELEKQQQLKLQKRQLIKDNLPEEPNKNEENVITIAIRLIDGSRVKRNFNKLSPVQDIYNFVDSSQEILEIDSYDLVAYPNRPVTDKESTIDENQIKSNDLLQISEH